NMMTDLNGTVNNSVFNAMNEFSRRSSGDPAIGDIYDIDILGPDNGSVVLSSMGSKYFDLTTIHTPETGDHPESGSREFGFRNNPDGSVPFYTSGASRPENYLSYFGGKPPQMVSWTSMMKGISNSIQKLGGVPRQNSFSTTRHSLSDAPDP